MLEMVQQRIVTPELDRFMPLLYESTDSPLAHVSHNALVILSEPRSLFDDCMRAYEDWSAVPARRRSPSWMDCTCVLSSSTLVASSVLTTCRSSAPAAP